MKNAGKSLFILANTVYFKKKVCVVQQTFRLISSERDPCPFEMLTRIDINFSNWETHALFEQSCWW